MPVTIVGALLPAVVTLLLGFFAAWRHDFDAEQGATLNRMVFRYALPLSLFVTTLGASLDNLVAQLPLAAVITSTMIASYLIVLLVARWIFHRDIMTAALQALAIAGPAAPFLGVPVLGYLFGSSAAAIPIDTCSIVELVKQRS